MDDEIEKKEINDNKDISDEVIVAREISDEEYNKALDVCLISSKVKDP